MKNSTKIKLSKAMKLRIKKFGHPNSGRKFGAPSLETRLKISKSMTGKRNSLGFKFSKEVRKRMALSHIGKCGVKKGNRHPRWKGGRIRMDKRGYIIIYSPDHPFKTKKGYVSEHRLIAEKKIGRFLKKEEVVHHINGIKDDNRPENLEVMTNAEHISFHKKCRSPQ